MKLSFTRRDQVQPAVAPEQETIRLAKPRSFPAARILLVALGLVLVLAVIYWLVNRGTIYSYGVVATGVEVFHAPVRSRVVSIHAEPGDRVVADSVLCVLVSDDAQTELKESQEVLGQQRGILETMLAEEHAAFDDPAVELRDLESGRASLQELERAGADAALSQTATDARLRLQVERLMRQVVFREEVLDGRSRRLVSAQGLCEAGAALPSEVEDAAASERLARYEWEEATSELAAAVAQGKAAEALHASKNDSLRSSISLARTYLDNLMIIYARARGKLERERLRGLENIRSRIASLEARVANLKKLAGPTEVRALADGVVTEVFVTDGSNVPKDAELLSLSGTGKLWINAFIPPDRVRDLHLNAPVMVYPTTNVHGIPGRITAGGGIQYKVHPSLRDRITDPSAVYVRIDLEGPKPDLIPGNVVRVVIR